MNWMKMLLKSQETRYQTGDMAFGRFNECDAGKAREIDYRIPAELGSAKNGVAWTWRT